MQFFDSPKFYFKNRKGKLKKKKFARISKIQSKVIINLERFSQTKKLTLSTVGTIHIYRENKYYHEKNYLFSVKFGNFK